MRKIPRPALAVLGLGLAGCADLSPTQQRLLMGAAGGCLCDQHRQAEQRACQAGYRQGRPSVSC